MRNRITELAIALAERGAPDRLVRAGMRRAIGNRLAAEQRRTDADRAVMLQAWHSGPIALVPDLANAQHYEVPAGFFELVLGPRLKYSSCLWPSEVYSLAEAEEAMLALTAERARLENGMRILELGSGWGSLSLWMAEHYPDSQILAVSNSSSQGDFIRSRAAAAGFTNLRHQVVDVNDLAVRGPFDAVVSVEMLEHVRNHPALLERLARVVVSGSPMFVHVFSHRDRFWAFEDRAAGDWMTRMFFAGGIMPSHADIARLLGPVTIAESWWVDGTHYERTLNAWLAQLDARYQEVAAMLAPVYGTAVERWIQRWRMFFMASAEFFGFGGGNTLGVSHHLLRLG
jgi:cyclopropane-fatty-acyl-phospholipid synthase